MAHDTRCLHGALQSVRPFFDELMVESPKSDDQRSVQSFSCLIWMFLEIGRSTEGFSVQENRGLVEL